MRQFNVFSELVVPYPGETFEWVMNPAEGSTVTLSPSNGSWPLANPSYTVNAGTPTSATASGEANSQGDFQCSPAAPGVTTQKIIVAAQAPIPVCEDVVVVAGDYFIWQNDTANAVSITPDPGNSNFWPLPSQEHEVPANGHLALQIPTDAEEAEYTLVVTSEGGGAVCPEAAQPKIIVGSNMG
jgi:hypothetical protein